MSSHRNAIIAWIFFGMVCLIGVVNAWISGTQLAELGLLQILNVLAFSAALPITFAGVGAFIVSRLPRNPIGWLLMSPSLVPTLVNPIQTFLATVAANPPQTLALWLMLWFENVSWLLLITLLFPSGRPPTPGWRWLAVALVGWPFLFVSLGPLASSVSSVDVPEVTVRNPFGILNDAQIEGFAQIWIGGLLVLIVLSIVALFARFRRAGPVERSQMKWLLYAGALFAVFYISNQLSGLYQGDGLGAQISNLLLAWTMILFPLAIGVAILRHRLYDIDLIIRRTLVYTVLTLSLGVIYFIGVVAFQELFVRLTGEESTLAAAASTLAIAAVFQPLRRWVQSSIDRRFFRKKYDAQQVLQQFARRVQQEEDLDAISADIVGTVQETLEPEGVKLWLVRSHRLTKRGKLA